MHCYCNGIDGRLTWVSVGLKRLGLVVGKGAAVLLALVEGLLGKLLFELLLGVAELHPVVFTAHPAVVGGRFGEVELARLAALLVGLGWLSIALALLRLVLGWGTSFLVGAAAFDPIDVRLGVGLVGGGVVVRGGDLVDGSSTLIVLDVGDVVDDLLDGLTGEVMLLDGMDEFRSGVVNDDLFGDGIGNSIDDFLSRGVGVGEETVVDESGDEFPGHDRDTDMKNANMLVDVLFGREGGEGDVFGIDVAEGGDESVFDGGPSRGLVGADGDLEDGQIGRAAELAFSLVGRGVVGPVGGRGDFLNHVDPFTDPDTVDLGVSMEFLNFEGVRV